MGKVAVLNERLTAWRDLCLDFRNQPFIIIEREISIEDAKRMYGFDAHPGAVSVQVGYTVHAPIEVEVDPWPKG
jgi:hypothetical protein